MDVHSFIPLAFAECDDSFAILRSFLSMDVRSWIYSFSANFSTVNIFYNSAQTKLQLQWLYEHSAHRVKDFYDIHTGSLRALGHSISSEPNFQHSDPRMKLSICETKTMNSFGDFFQNFKKVGF
jgi:hypothetical protein